VVHLCRVVLLAAAGTVLHYLRGYGRSTHKAAAQPNGTPVQPGSAPSPPPLSKLKARPGASASNPAQGVLPRGGDLRENPKDGLKYAWIPAGKFMMGCSPGDHQCLDDEKPRHEVQITRGFWLGQTEVTQAAFERVMKYNPSHQRGPTLPVNVIGYDNWPREHAKHNALYTLFQYCKAIDGRLPTAEEWEYAARADTTTARYGALEDIAWYRVNAVHPVALKQPNAWGLYDMLGNVMELVGTETPSDVLGGSWHDEPLFLRASARFGQGHASLATDNVVGDIGCRCVWNAEASTGNATRTGPAPTR
jgi:formylglycine-generating enzyme required for sulfatase activity